MISSTNPIVFTLITGASAGIGRALAEECARLKQNVLLVALPDIGEMATFAAFLQTQYGIQAHCLSLDLCEPDAPEQVFAWIQREYFAVNILINNAGIGTVGPFESASAVYYQQLIQLNVVALVKLTHLLLPELKKHPRSYILNVSSLAAFFNMPYKIIYAASKHFVYAFSRALRIELAPSSVTVTVLCPGAVITNDTILARVRQVSPLAEALAWYPEAVAKLAIQKMLAGHATVIPGWFNRLTIWLSYLVPVNIRLHLIGYLFGRKYKKQPALISEPSLLQSAANTLQEPIYQNPTL